MGTGSPGLWGFGSIYKVNMAMLSITRVKPVGRGGNLGVWVDMICPFTGVGKMKPALSSDEPYGI